MIGGYNGSGSLITANHAFEQDREVFFTIPDDTLDKKYSRVIRFCVTGRILFMISMILSMSFIRLTVTESMIHILIRNS